MIKNSTSHLKKTNQNYWAHGWFAVRHGFYIILIGIVSILHGIFPFFMPFFAPRSIMKLARMIEARGNEDEMGEFSPNGNRSSD